MAKTRLIIVGGFLGAGKTTLLWETAKHFINKGLKVGLITNDQAPELVDSAILKLSGLSVAEVSGSCFCCNFNGFTDAIKKLQGQGAPDVIIAEPVGSCADLSATILQPLKKFFSAELELAPFTVAADPNRLPSILEGGNGGLHPDAAYIFGKQLEESDILLLTKSDTLSAEKQEELLKKLAEKYPTSSVMAVSAVTGEGLEAWMEQVTTRNDVGRKLLKIDYDKYAHGEAVLGWLNGTVKLLGPATAWNEVVKAFVTGLAAKFEAEGLPVGHVKAIVENGLLFAVSNLTQDSRTLTLRGDAGESTEATLVINARVETTPEHLDELVRAELQALLADKYEQTELAWKFLQPGRPNPTHRFVEIV